MGKVNYDEPVDPAPGSILEPGKTAPSVQRASAEKYKISQTEWAEAARQVLNDDDISKDLS